MIRLTSRKDKYNHVFNINHIFHKLILVNLNLIIDDYYSRHDGYFFWEVSAMVLEFSWLKWIGSWWTKDELDSAVFSGASHWICLLPYFYHLLPFRQWKRVADIWIRWQQEDSKKTKVRTQGTVEFNLDGGDAALVETAVEITLVTCRSEFVSGDFSWFALCKGQVLDAACVEPRQTGFPHQNHMTTMSALVSLSLLCGTCGDSMVSRDVSHVWAQVITTNSDHHV